MAESAQYINSLIITSPNGDDYKYDGAAQLRVIKSATKNTFPNISGAVTATDEELNTLSGASVNLAAQLQSVSSNLADVSSRLGSLSSTANILSQSLSALNTAYSQGRDVMPKHFASYRFSDSISFHLSFEGAYNTFAPTSTDHRETTLSIIESVLTSSYPLPPYNYTSWETKTGYTGRYTRLKTPAGCTRVRVTLNLSCRYLTDLSDGTVVYELPGLHVYNYHKSNDYYKDNLQKSTYVRRMQHMYYDYTVSALISFKQYIQYNQQNYVNTTMESREFTVSPGSVIVVGLLPTNDSIIQNYFYNSSSSPYESNWIEAEYR